MATYLRGQPDHVIRKLGEPPADMEKLRRCGEAHPPSLYGRVSAVSVLRSARCLTQPPPAQVIRSYQGHAGGRSST